MTEPKPHRDVLRRFLEGPPGLIHAPKQKTSFLGSNMLRISRSVHQAIQLAEIC